MLNTEQILILNFINIFDKFKLVLRTIKLNNILTLTLTHVKNI